MMTIPARAIPLRQKALILLIPLMMLSLSACGEGQERTSDTGPGGEDSMPATEIDRDPTAQTGSGGERQSTSEDGTIR